MRPLRFRGALKGIWRPPGGDLSAFGGLLGGFSGRIESSVERLETPEGDWRALGGVWRPLGSDLKVFGSLWGGACGRLGSSWNFIEGIVGALGAILKPSEWLCETFCSRLMVPRRRLERLMTAFCGSLPRH